MKSLISIIIPVFNSENWLPTLFESIDKQRYTCYEVILVDDESTDKSGELCDVWAGKNNRVRVIHKNNEGVSIARNIGIEYARGEFITFVDSDDWIDPDYLLMMMEIPHSFDLVITGLFKEYTNHREEFTPPDCKITLTPESSELFFELTRKELLFGPWVKRYKKEIMGKYRIRFPEGISFGEDLLFNYQYFEYIKEIVCVPFSAYHYRKEIEGSLCKRFISRGFELEYEQWNIVRSFLSRKGMLNSKSEQFLSHRLFWCAYDYLIQYGKLKEHYSMTERFREIRNTLSVKELRIPAQTAVDYEAAPWIKKCICGNYPLLLWVLLETKFLRD